MKSRIGFRLYMVLGLLGSPFYASGIAHAFSEDLCVEVNEEGDVVKLVNCLDGATCDPERADTALCRANLVYDAHFAVQEAPLGRARSMMHVDATYVLARSVGFSAVAAYWIAAYNQVADVGTYIPFGISGGVVDRTPQLGVVRAAPLNGWSRANQITSSLSYHQPAPYSPDGRPFAPSCEDDALEHVPAESIPICGATPDLEDALYEATLTHVRAWARGERGSFGVDDACAGGFTEADAEGGYSTAPTCFEHEAAIAVDPTHAPRHIGGFLPTLTGLPFGEPFRAFSGKQIVKYDMTPEIADDGIHDVRFADELGAALAESYTPAELHSVLGRASMEEFLPLVRMGIYLHVLQDRISHHHCADRSLVRGPSEKDRFIYQYDVERSGMCTQDMHALNHYLEIGHDDLPLRTRTALEYTYDELLLMASNRNLQRWLDPLGRVIDRDQIVGDILEVFAVDDACARLQNMILLLDDYHFEQMPGNAASPGQIATMCLSRPEMTTWTGP